MLLKVYYDLARDGKRGPSGGGSKMSTSYAAGLAFGIVTALIIFALIWKFSKNR